MKYFKLFSISVISAILFVSCSTIGEDVDDFIKTNAPPKVVEIVPEISPYSLKLDGYLTKKVNASDKTIDMYYALDGGSDFNLSVPIKNPDSDYYVCTELEPKSGNFSLSANAKCSNSVVSLYIGDTQNGIKIFDHVTISIKKLTEDGKYTEVKNSRWTVNFIIINDKTESELKNAINFDVSGLSTDLYVTSSELNQSTFDDPAFEIPITNPYNLPLIIEVSPDNTVEEADELFDASSLFSFNNDYTSIKIEFLREFLKVYFEHSSEPYTAAISLLFENGIECYAVDLSITLNNE